MRLIVRACVLVMLPLGALAVAAPASAATILVTTAAEEVNSDGDCSLQEALSAANNNQSVDACGTGSGADTINVPAGTYNITSQLLIQEDLTLVGAGAASTIIDGGGSTRLFNVSTGGAEATVGISGMTLQDGSATSGAGVLSINTDTSLTISSSVLTSNAASTGGGGINNGGTLSLTNTTVTGNSAVNGGGIFNACCTSTATLTGSTVTGNSAPSGRGGGIYNQASLTLVNTDVTNNSGASGGGIWNPAGGTTVSITGGSVSGNTSVGTAGGIFNQNGTLTIDGVTISDNSTSGLGGGIQNEGNGSATITDSTISENSAVNGGGIFGHATLSLVNTTVTGNTGGGIDCRCTATVDASTISGNTGSGFHSEGSATITDTTISNNTAGGFDVFQSSSTGTITTVLDGLTVTGNTGGSGISSGTQFASGGASDVTIRDSLISGNTGSAGGGVNNFADAGTMTIERSTISGNTGADAGGGIYNLDGTLALTDSTVSGNTTPGTCCGGGIFNEKSPPSPTGGTITITNSTISGNSAPNSSGGGIENHGTLTLESSTVSGNTAPSPFGGLKNGATVNMGGTILANNTGDCVGTVNSTGYNLIEDTSACTIGGNTTGNIIGQDPKLGPLADNGGPTFTHVLLAGSPALDAGNPSCPPPFTDQRGVFRPQGADCDQGSTESAVGVGAVSVDDPATLLATGRVQVTGTLFCGPAGDTSRVFVRVDQATTDAISKIGVDPGTCSGGLDDPWTVTPGKKTGSPAFVPGEARVCFQVRTLHAGVETDRLTDCVNVTLVAA